MSSVTLFALCPYNEHGCFSPHMAELHTLPYPASRTAYVLASDYERDTQALRDDYNEACADAMQVAGKLQAVEAERDALRALRALRAQVEVMQADSDLYRQWFNAVQDLNPRYLEQKDYQAAVRLLERLNIRVPLSVVAGASKL